MAITVNRLKPVHSNPAHQSVQYMYRRFTYNDVDQTNSSRFSVATPIGGIPANCLPLETYVHVIVAFSSGDICIGTSDSGSSAGVVSTQDLQSGTTGTYVIDRYYGTVSTVDKAFYFYTATTGAGAGVAEVWQAYLPGNAKDTT